MRAFTVLVVPAAAAAALVATSQDVRVVAGTAVVALVVAAASFPRATMVLAVAVAVWPATSVVAAYGLMGCASLGVLLRRGLGGIGRIALLLGLFAGLCAVSLYTADGPFAVLPSEARNHLMATLVGLLLVLGGATCGLSHEAALKLLALSGTASAAYLLSVGAAQDTGRLEIETLNPNTVGQIAALAVLAAVGTAVASGNARWLALTVPGVVALVQAQSRGSLVTLAIGLAALWLFMAPSRGRFVTATVMPAAVFFAWPLLQAAIGSFLSRRQNIGGEEIRIESAKLGLRLAADNPLLGTGWRTFPDFSSRALGVPINAHNEYVRVAAEAGFIALACLIAVVLVALRSRAPARAGAACRALSVGGLAGLAVNNALSLLTVVTPTFLLLGVLLSSRLRPVRQGTPTADVPPGVQMSSHEAG